MSERAQSLPIHQPLPHAEHAERAVLGALLIDSTAYQRVAQQLHPDDFYHPAHRLLWEAIAHYYDHHAAIDVIGLGEALRQAGTLSQIGGVAYLEHLADTTLTADHLDEHAEIIREMAGKRRLIEIAYQLANDAHGTASVREILAELDATTIPLAKQVTSSAATCLAHVEPKPIEWLWPQRMPLGMIVILDGDPGLGKSTVSLDLAARVSTGRPMPDHTSSCLRGPATVLLMGAEDDLARTIQPRLKVAGADLSRIYHLGVEELPSLTAVGLIRQAVQHHDARLLVIDPLMAYLPCDVNAYRDQDMRRILSPLAALAAELQVTILLIRHLTKTGGTQVIYRGGGSIGIIGAARSGMLITEHPEDSDKRVLAMSKANLAHRALSLIYRLEGNPIPSVIWEGTTRETATHLLELAELTTDERSALHEAAHWLFDYLLREGPQSSSVVIDKSQKAGIAPATLKRAKAKLQIRSYREGDRWMMALPEPR